MIYNHMPIDGSIGGKTQGDGATFYFIFSRLTAYLYIYVYLSMIAGNAPESLF